MRKAKASGPGMTKGTAVRTTLKPVFGMRGGKKSMKRSGRGR